MAIREEQVGHKTRLWEPFEYFVVGLYEECKVWPTVGQLCGQKYVYSVYLLGSCLNTVRCKSAIWALSQVPTSQHHTDL